MATAMTKMLAVGMPIASVIAAATTTPAKTIGWGDRIGSLEPGMAADIAVLELQETGQQGEGGGAEMPFLSHIYIYIIHIYNDQFTETGSGQTQETVGGGQKAFSAGPLLFEDCQAQMRPIVKRLVGRCVWKAGREFAVTCPEEDDSHRFGFPSKRSIAMGRPAWDTLVVRDSSPPPPVEPEFEAMVEAALAALKERADEAMLRSSVGDGNPNVPFGLSLLPFCIDAAASPISAATVDGGGGSRVLAIEDRKAPSPLADDDEEELLLLDDQEGPADDESAAAAVLQPQLQPHRRRMLISFPESEAYLEKLRREALMIGCC
jgi:hypothetical protein